MQVRILLGAPIRPCSPNGRDGGFKTRAVEVRVLPRTPTWRRSPLGRHWRLGDFRRVAACRCANATQAGMAEPADAAGLNPAGPWPVQDRLLLPAPTSSLRQAAKGSGPTYRHSEVRILEGAPLPSNASQSERRGPRPITEWQVARLHRLAPINLHQAHGDCHARHAQTGAARRRNRLRDGPGALNPNGEGADF